MAKAHDILTFWFDEAGSEKWYKKSDAFDAEIRARFEAAAIDMAAVRLKGSHLWEDKPDSSLALIIALDQFSRNMYRGTKAAFGWDPLSLAVSKDMADKGWDLKIPQDRRAFVYMPLMHSEVITDQDRCVELMDSRLKSANSLHHAKEHRKVIRKFGRFPHRNEILGRESTQQEIKFLKSGGYAP